MRPKIGKPMDDLEKYKIKDGEVLAEISRSVCPVCLEVLDCQIVFRDNKVFLRKYCEKHGLFEVMVYSEIYDYINAEKYNKPGTTPLQYQGSIAKGCPHDCGLCEAHLQHTCVGVIEITDMCNLNCPICFADAKNSFTLPFKKVKEMIDLYVKCERQPEVLHISGGEPTLHPDLLEILRYADQKGIMYLALNTNGLKLADRDFAEKLSLTRKNEKFPTRTPSIYLQFDGLSDDTYLALRGRPLINLKMQAIKNCKKLGMDVTLVPMIVKGINEHEIGPIIDLALRDSNIKSVNFQPSTLVGRYGLNNSQNRRMTLPEILCEIEHQTSGSIKKKSFINIPCPHPTCSAGAYFYKSKGGIVALTDILDVDKYMDYIVNRAIPDRKLMPEIKKAINAMETILSMSAMLGTTKTDEAVCTLCQKVIPDIGDLIDNITLISVHAFMDEYNFDLKKARKCCVTEILPNGQMIPFCVYNIFYRKNLIVQKNPYN